MKGNVVMLDFVFRIYFIDVESWEIIVTVDKAWSMKYKIPKQK